MEKNPASVEELRTIRKIMEESTRFFSLSGLSGVFLGIFAIAGVFVAWLMSPDRINTGVFGYLGNLPLKVPAEDQWYLAVIALVILTVSLVTAFYFSNRKAKLAGRKFLTPVSKRLLINLFIPLAAGGIFALSLIIGGHVQLIIPVLLIFYGLALINAGKFTYNEIFYLGILEIITGLISAFFPLQGLLFWIVGFGILHITYGLFMYRKYEA